MIRACLVPGAEGVREPPKAPTEPRISRRTELGAQQAERLDWQKPRLTEAADPFGEHLRLEHSDPFTPFRHCGPPVSLKLEALQDRRSDILGILADEGSPRSPLGRRILCVRLQTGPFFYPAGQVKK